MSSVRGESRDLGVAHDRAACSPGPVRLLMDEHPHPERLVRAEPRGGQHQFRRFSDQTWAPLVIEDPERHGDVDLEARASSAAVTSAPAGSTCR